MIHSENGNIRWEGDDVTVGSELTHLLYTFRKEEPEIFIISLLTLSQKLNEGKEKK